MYVYENVFVCVVMKATPTVLVPVGWVVGVVTMALFLRSRPMPVCRML